MITRAHALLFGTVVVGANALVAQAQQATVRLAVLTIEPAAEGYFAKDMGFFAKAGIDIDIQAMQSSNAVAAALASNAVDIGYCTVRTRSLTR